MTDQPDLREVLAKRLCASLYGSLESGTWALMDEESREGLRRVADNVLALPAIANALKLTVVKPLNLGPSVSTNKRTPV
jgi:hypothetical protein